MSKAEAVKPSSKEISKIIREKNIKNVFNEEDVEYKEFIKSQQAYRIKFKQRILKQYELEEMKSQIESDRVKMLWYGMPYPIEILKASYNLVIESYSQMLSEEEELKKTLIEKYKLTKSDLKGVLDGTYIKKIKK